MKNKVKIYNDDKENNINYCNEFTIEAVNTESFNVMDRLEENDFSLLDNMVESTVENYGPYTSNDTDDLLSLKYTEIKGGQVSDLMMSYRYFFKQFGFDVSEVTTTLMD